MSDPCECVFSHEAAMRRLLSLLRDVQNFCTDSECVNDGPGGAPQGNLIMWTLLWGLIAAALFYLRPNSLRSGQRQREDPAAEKPGPSDDQQQPPPPPPPGGVQ